MELERFINDVLHHFMNRTSQREKVAFRTFEIYKEGEKKELLEKLPETIGFNRGLLPDETFVLVGYYKSQEHLDWIIKNKLYNARTGSARGTIAITSKEAGAKYLLLYTKYETVTSRLYKLSDRGPAVFTNNDLSTIGYPDPMNDTYLVFTLEEGLDIEFSKMVWDLSRLKDFPKKANMSL
jgi:hypothetical protein